MSAENSHTKFDVRLDSTVWKSAIPGSLLFMLLSLLVIPLAGFEDDEVLFLTPFRLGIPREFALKIFHHELPLMTMSYLGGLKTWLYYPFWKLFGLNSVWGVRLPVVLISAVTIFFFSYLCYTCAGRRAAVVGPLLLACQPVYLLTSVFDWGPVAIEHLLLTAASVCFVRYCQTSDERLRKWGFFLLGLALWNKAIFLWALAGITVASLVFWAEIRPRLSRSSLLSSALFFGLGASPFLLYNIRHFGATIGDNARFDALSVWPAKLSQLQSAADGYSLFGFLVEEEYGTNPKAVLTLVGRLAAWLHEHQLMLRDSKFSYVALALLALVPLWWKSRGARFSIVFSCIAWMAMAVSKGAGASAHHSILLWPFPVLFVSIAVARIQWRPLFVLIVAGLALSGLSVYLRHVYLFERVGAANAYSDALFRLAPELDKIVQRDQRVWMADWGIANGLDVTSSGRFSLNWATGPFMQDQASTEDARMGGLILKDPGGVFVGHVPEREFFKGVGRRIEERSKSIELVKTVLATVADSNGRPVYEIYRILPGAPGAIPN